MPLITVTTRRPKTRAFKDAVLAGVHSALVSSGVPATDLFQRVLELDDENFRYDATYPDLARARSDQFVLIEIVLSVGRSVKVKRELLKHLIEALGREPGLHPDDVFVCFQETRWENWSFGGGRLIHA